MQRRYATVDVFTDRVFGGNPLAVVLDAAGLSTAQMQAITCEFNYSETTFLLPPRDPAHTAWVRIFNPSREMPFAGHPNVGTAFVVARAMATRGETVPDQFIFEEGAGLVVIRLLRDGTSIIGAELKAPEPLSRRSEVTVEAAVSCLSLSADAICAEKHRPQVISVGMPFLVVELSSRSALRRAAPSRAAYAAVLPLDGAHSVYAYTRDVGPDTPEADTDLQARMFTSRMNEDPATGSATAAVTALLADVQGTPVLGLRVGQGVDMGRPSLMVTRGKREGGAVSAWIGGHCVEVMEGRLVLVGEETGSTG